MGTLAVDVYDQNLFTSDDLLGDTPSNRPFTPEYSGNPGVNGVILQGQMTC
jgi:hypothetical protein